MAEYSPINFWQSAATSSSFLDFAISLNAINDKEIVVNPVSYTPPSPRDA